MIRSAVLSLALLSGPALAQYRAQPQNRPAEARVIARDVVWRCGDGGCVAQQNHSRPAVVCALLVREVGALTSFTARGQTFDAQELENCNRRAR